MPAAELESSDHWSQPWRPGRVRAFVAARRDRATQSMTLTMEDGGDRYVAARHDDARVVTGLTFLLDWHLGRSLAQIANLEVRL